MVCQDINREFQWVSVRNDVFTPITQILFLNKIDLFAEKLPRSPLGDYFPDFTGGDSYDAACEYLLHRYDEVVIFCHFHHPDWFIFSGL